MEARSIDNRIDNVINFAEANLSSPAIMRGALNGNVILKDDIDYLYQLVFGSVLKKGCSDGLSDAVIILYNYIKKNGRDSLTKKRFMVRNGIIALPASGHYVDALAPQTLTNDLALYYLTIDYKGNIGKFISVPEDLDEQLKAFDMDKFISEYQSRKIVKVNRVSGEKKCKESAREKKVVAPVVVEPVKPLDKDPLNFTPEATGYQVEADQEVTATESEKVIATIKEFLAEKVTKAVMLSVLQESYKEVDGVVFDSKLFEQLYKQAKNN